MSQRQPKLTTRMYRSGRDRLSYLTKLLVTLIGSPRDDSQLYPVIRRLQDHNFGPVLQRELLSRSLSD